VVCLPFFADQYDVAARIVDSGAGLQLDKTTLTPEDVKAAVNVELHVFARYIVSPQFLNL
jgi:UDP:flavonoid glycosyltransferase YjiC (YdhE family)